MSSGNLYSTLGIPSDADAAEVRKAYRRLAMQHHPDKNPNDPEAVERFRAVQAAYDVLSDPEQRRIYDGQQVSFEFSSSVQIEPYLHVEVEAALLSLNEEIEVRFAFPSEGRFFKRGSMPDWAVCEGPTFSHRMSEETGTRETVLHFRLAPLRAGRLIIPPAQIFFDHKPAFSTPLVVEVLPTSCAFCKGRPAGDKPLRVYLNKEHVTSTSAYRKTVIRERMVLIPRSALATFYHKIGETLMVAIPFIGTAWALGTGHRWWIALPVSWGVAWVNVRVMYALMHIKSVQQLRKHYPRVVELLAAGYKPGRR